MNELQIGTTTAIGHFNSFGSGYPGRQREQEFFNEKIKNMEVPDLFYIQY